MENRIGANPTMRWQRPCMGVQSVFPSTRRSCLENTEVLKQGVERGEEATMSPEGLSYPKSSNQLEWRWTQRSATETSLLIVKERDTEAKRRIVGPWAWQRHGIAEAGLPCKSLIPCSHGGRALGRERGRGGGACRGNLQVSRQG